MRNLFATISAKNKQQKSKNKTIKVVGSVRNHHITLNLDLRIMVEFESNGPIMLTAN